MRYLVETNVIIKRNKRSGRACQWTNSRRRIEAESVEEAGLADDQANLIEYGTSDFGTRSITAMPVKRERVAA